MATRNDDVVAVALTGREVLTVHLGTLAAAHAAEAVRLGGYDPTPEQLVEVPRGLVRAVLAGMALLTDEEILAAGPGQLEAAARETAARVVATILGKPPAAN